MIRMPLLFLILGGLVIVAAPVWAQTPPFNVNFVSGPSTPSTTYPGSTVPTLFNMVVGSTQQLEFTVTPNVNPPPPIIYCSVANTAGMDTISTLGGCSKTGSIIKGSCIAGATGGPSCKPTGAGTPYTLVFTITAGNAPGAVKDTLTIQNVSGSTVMNFPLNYTVVANSTRTITFQNYCSFDVWFGATPGVVPETCAFGAGCPNGTTCVNPSAATSACAWNQPTVKNNNPGYYLVKYNGSSPATNTVTITDYTTGHSPIDGFQVWSGNFSGRTYCDSNGANCKTADCAATSTPLTGTCTTGPTGPATLAEFTLLTTQPDSYDVSVINGLNLAMSITPSLPQGTSKPYDCGVPGSTRQVSYSDGLYNSNGVLAKPYTGGLAGASWTFNPPTSGNYYYQYVDGSTSHTCTTDHDCTQYANTVCGLTYSNVGTSGPGNAQLTCGNPLGYWTQDQICAQNHDFNSTNIVNCTNNSISLSSQSNIPSIINACTNPGTNTSGSCPSTVSSSSGYNFFNLVAGTTAPPELVNDKLTFASCFAANTQTASSVNCSGCNNWQELINPFPNDTNFVPQCGTSATTTPNPSWVYWILPNIQWLKQACPSCYTYVYDDKTSGFGCPYAYETGQSAVNYTVTFCPGGKTGIPSIPSANRHRQKDNMLL